MRNVWLIFSFSPINFISFLTNAFNYHKTINSSNLLGVLGFWGFGVLGFRV